MWGWNNLIFLFGYQMLKTLYFQMAMNTCEMWFDGIKKGSFFFKKLQKIGQRPEALPPRPPAVIRLSNNSFAHNSFLIWAFSLFNFWFKPSLISKTWITAKPGHDFWSSILLYFHKNFLFRKFLMTSLHVICGVGPPIKNHGYFCARSWCITTW